MHEQTASVLVSLIAGGTAGGVEAFMTYPFEFTKTRYQLRQTKGLAVQSNPFKLLRQIYRAEGLRAVYKGCGALAAGSVAKDAIRFLTYDFVKANFRDPVTGQMSLGGNMAAGASAGVLASITCVTPTERLKTALVDDARSEKRFRSTFHAIRTIVAEDGLVGLYRGLVGTTLKQASASACRLGFYNTIKDFETRRHIQQNTVISFANGCVSGTLTTLVTQPFDVIKTVSQSSHRTTTVEAVRGIIHDYGLRGFWRGTLMRLGRTVLAGGILFSTAETVHKLIEPLFVKPGR